MHGLFPPHSDTSGVSVDSMIRSAVLVPPVK